MDVFLYISYYIGSQIRYRYLTKQRKKNVSYILSFSLVYMIPYILEL
jgi:hypothetical protein